MNKELFEKGFEIETKIKGIVHISEYSDSNAGVQPDTFAMRFSRL
jgi:ribosomal protein S1